MSSILIDKHFAFQVVFPNIMTVTQNPSFRHKIIVLPYTYTLSHLSRPLAIAKELRNRGFEMIFAGESPKTGFVREEGFEVVPVFEPEAGELFENIRRGRLYELVSHLPGRNSTEIPEFFWIRSIQFWQTFPSLKGRDGCRLC